MDSRNWLSLSGLETICDGDEVEDIDGAIIVEITSPFVIVT